MSINMNMFLKLAYSQKFLAMKIAVVDKSWKFYFVKFLDKHFICIMVFTERGITYIQIDSGTAHSNVCADKHIAVVLVVDLAGYKGSAVETSVDPCCSLVGVGVTHLGKEDGNHIKKIYNNSSHL